MERMDVLKAGKAVEYGLEFLAECLGREFDLASVEASDSTDLEACADLGG